MRIIILVTGRIISLFVIASLLLIVFVAIQFWKKENATVPPRIISQRSMAFGSWFGFALGGSFFILIYFIPIWFQAIKGTSAVGSGIRNLPMIMGLVIMSILSGILVTVIGYYTPFMIASSVFMAVGVGLLSTFEVDTGHAKWIGYQVIYGFGVGLGMQQALIAAQTVLHINDVPVGTSLVMFLQTLGGALFISIAQNIFKNRLLSNLAAANISGPDISSVLQAGATGFKTYFVEHNPAILGDILIAYNKALQQTFYVSVAIAALSIIGSAGMEWQSVKGKKIEAAMA